MPLKSRYRQKFRLIHVNAKNKYSLQGFPNGVDFVGGDNLCKVAKKLHENDKIDIFRAKQWGLGGTS